MTHFAPDYFLDPQHPITVALAGCGGTGSQVLTLLSRMDFALRGLGHPGFHVKAFDNDTVSESNVGRQLFSPSEIGLNKAEALITRVNRFFGLDWEAVPYHFNKERKKDGSARVNIIVSCVDTVKKGRWVIAEMFKMTTHTYRPFENSYYWLDFGNAEKTGQAVLGTVHKIKQPKGGKETLPTIRDLHPDMTDDDQGPSCSIAEALRRQDLFINTTVATLGMDILWKLFREAKIEHHGVYLNLDTMKVNPLKA